nr:FKBP-type peptidyl-prolyl cis-trans isomerase [Kibdelosporangium sp. MJ126-NF4]CEL22628.1 peptidylprolyl isomerase, FKBP-type [Kibdelosporangium sp. MJ126-NF4]CTQ89770.1 peptidylprolyl isomerase, FKBP-type(EC:5.2.1.8) [Kibdelosporangium sp. MJ126-NF4]
MRIAGKVTMVSVALVAAATLSACANSEQASTGTLPITQSSTPPPTKSSPKPTATTAQSGAATGSECTADDVKVEGEFGAKPTITIPATCQPPKKLLSKDLKPGTGAEVKAGSTATVFYQLITWSDKKEVDGNFGDKPFPVQNVGQARVIPGWNEGLIGLKANGRRLLVIPPDKAYGEGGQGIKPNETLVFVIDAQQVS